MKKILSIVFGLVAVTILTVAASAAQQVTASYPNFNITLNGVRVDNQSRQYPLIVYNEITYFPMTYYDCLFLGLTSEWNPATNTLSINKADVDGAYSNQPYSNPASGYFPAKVCDFAISVNGNAIYNQYETFPLLNYRDVTYFPLTWRFAHDEFGWNYSYTAEGGLVINSGNYKGTPTVTSGELSAQQIYNACSPAVFYIETYGQNGRALSSGSGFFIDNYGTAVTNYHVVDEAYSAKIQLAGTGAVYNILGVYDYSENNDWAIIKTDCYNSSSLSVDYYASVTGGETVYAIGSPEGLQNTISQGIVSNPSRDIDGTTYIQITAAISHGSSGGALINRFGKVIGITSAGYEDGQNLNFAIPISAMRGFSTANATPLSSFNSAYYTPSTPQRPSTSGSTSTDGIYYSKFYGVPDFGALTGATLKQTVPTESSYGYYYYTSGISEDDLELYIYALGLCGFEHQGNIEYQGYTQAVFRNSKLGCSLSMGIAAWDDSFLVLISF